HAPVRGLVGMLCAEVRRAYAGVHPAWIAALAGWQAIVDVGALFLAAVPEVVPRDWMGTLGLYAAGDAPIALTGPPGCGKTNLAHWVSDRDPNPRRFERLVAARLTPRQIEAAVAVPGTLLIDDIEGLMPEAQGALLHAFDGARSRLVLTCTEDPRRLAAQ